MSDIGMVTLWVGQKGRETVYFLRDMNGPKRTHASGYRVLCLIVNRFFLDFLVNCNYVSLLLKSVSLVWIREQQFVDSASDFLP